MICCLWGDSAGNTAMGFDSTVPVTMDMMVHHCTMVRRGAPNSFIVGDMPFMSAHLGEQEALGNAVKLIQHGGCDAVKIEGANELELIKKLVNGGVPVMGHVGLLPQRVKTQGGFLVAGRNEAAVAELLTDAAKLEAAGVFALVVECVPSEVGKKLAETVNVPVIGIGAGDECDGQVQVVYDLLGLDADFLPKHAKKYADLYTVIVEAFKAYRADVKDGAFPTKDNFFS